MPPSRDPASFLPINSDTLMILLAVANVPRHGYGIIRDVEERSNGEILLQTGALYRNIKRLHKDGLLTEVPPPPDAANEDSRRRYYRLSRLGAAVLDAEVTRMSLLVRAAKVVATGGTPKLA